MAKIASAAEVAAKWARVTPQRATEYAEGVRNPSTDWATATKAGAESWKQGIQAAAQSGRYEKAIAAAGTEKWQRKTIEKGPTRFAEGVATSAPDFQAGFEPYRATIEATQLPPRFAKGDPRNIERVKVLAVALRKRKTG